MLCPPKKGNKRSALTPTKSKAMQELQLPATSRQSIHVGIQPVYSQLTDRNHANKESMG